MTFSSKYKHIHQWIPWSKLLKTLFVQMSYDNKRTPPKITLKIRRAITATHRPHIYRNCWLYLGNKYFYAYYMYSWLFLALSSSIRFQIQTLQIKLQNLFRSTAPRQNCLDVYYAKSFPKCHGTPRFDGLPFHTRHNSWRNS